MLSVKNLGYRISSERWLVRDITFSLSSGEVVIFVGPNGAGKTTLLRLISGELTPHIGDILICNKPLKTYSARQLALQRSVMRQHFEMNFDFTVEDVVMMGRHPHIRFMEGEHDRRVVNEVLHLTQSDELRERYYATLSGGEKARVTLARVLAQQTPLVFLDEPTSAMDLQHQHMTMKIARRLAEDGRAVLAVLHDLNLAAMYADRIGIIVGGRLNVLDVPQNVLTKEHIQAAFGIDVQIIQHPQKECPVIIPLHS
ncbi:MAG: heme ABC transporter ATP-binding protein [Phototrophicales bacterium]|nr:MAG: heme ABC transporter ATP-binding protein [Phototrophicales bacterium]